MCGGRNWVSAISGPHVMFVVPVRMRPIEKIESGNDDGLKMCALFPSLVQRISALAAKPTATIRNCR